MIIESLKELTDAEIAILEKHSSSVILIWAGGSEQDGSVMIIRRKHDVKPPLGKGRTQQGCRQRIMDEFVLK